MVEWLMKDELVFSSRRAVGGIMVGRDWLGASGAILKTSIYYTTHVYFQRTRFRGNLYEFFSTHSTLIQLAIIPSRHCSLRSQRSR